MIFRAVLLLSLFALSACAAAPRPLPRAEAPAAEPPDPSIKSLVQEQEEQAG